MACVGQDGCGVAPNTDAEGRAALPVIGNPDGGSERSPEQGSWRCVVRT